MRVKDQVARQLNVLTKRPLKRLDRMLLKGFYTNDRLELENPSLLTSTPPEPAEHIDQVHPEPNDRVHPEPNGRVPPEPDDRVLPEPDDRVLPEPNDRMPPVGED